MVANNSLRLCILLNCLIAVSGWLAADRSVAQEQSFYEVEMVVFASNREYPREQWLLIKDLYFPDKVVTLVEPDVSTASDSAGEAYWLREPSGDQKIAYRVLPVDEGNEDSLFTELVELLNSTNRYRILFHRRWLHPAHSRDEAPQLLIEGGSRFGDYRELMGTVRLGISRYLHFNVDLWLTSYTANGRGKGEQPLPPLPPKSEADASAAIDSFALKAHNISNNIKDELRDSSTVPGATRVLRIQESRKMRSDEAHYLDHPQFGVIVRIRKSE